MATSKTGKLFTGELTTVNQILPHRHRWAWNCFLEGQKNNWVPTEVSMARDIEDWRSPTCLSEDEKLLVRRCLGFFAGGESLVSNNLLLGVFRVISDPECRQYLLRQGYEECYAAGTEALTPTGWKDIAQLADDEPVAQYHSDSSIDFVVPSHRTRRSYTGPMFRFRGGAKKVDLLVTPGHRMVYRDEHGEVGVQEAGKISYSHKQFLLTGRKKEVGIASLTPWQRFLVAFQADGSFQGGKYRNGNRNGGFLVATFALTKERKKSRLRDICKDAGFRYTVRFEKRGNGREIYSVWVPREFQLSKKFDWVNLEEVSGSWCVDFLEELTKWDGWHYKGRGCGYDTTVPYNADLVQAVAALAGWRCSRRTHYDKRKESYKPLHRLNFVMGKDHVSRGTVRKTVEEYSGEVFCLTVPTGMLVIRQNGKVHISGNCLHNQTIVYICDSLGLEISDVYEAYERIPVIKAKTDFLQGITTDLSSIYLDITSDFGKREALRSIVTYYILCEGILFYSGFTMLLNFGRQNKLPGISEQITYTLRDEQVHLKFGTQLINTIKEQEPQLWDTNFQKEVISNVKKATELEIAYAKEVLPRGILGLSSEMFVDYMRFIANLRLAAIGLPEQFSGTRNPFPWLAESIELKKQKNFFETRVQEYQVGSLEDDF